MKEDIPRSPLGLSGSFWVGSLGCRVGGGWAGNECLIEVPRNTCPLHGHFCVSPPSSLPRLLLLLLCIALELECVWVWSLPPVWFYLLSHAVWKSWLRCTVWVWKQSDNNITYVPDISLIFIYIKSVEITSEWLCFEKRSSFFWPMPLYHKWVWCLAHGPTVSGGHWWTSMIFNGRRHCWLYTAGKGWNKVKIQSNKHWGQHQKVKRDKGEAMCAMINLIP